MLPKNGKNVSLKLDLYINKNTSINDKNLIDCESNREELLKTIKEYNYTLVKELPGEFYHYIQSKD